MLWDSYFALSDENQGKAIMLILTLIIGAILHPAIKIPRHSNRRKKRSKD